MPETALVLGAGGAGRAAAWALREGGAEVAIWNRTPARAAALADELGVRHAVTPGPVDLLVNATSVGLDPGDRLDDLPLVDAAVVVDLTYGEGPTPLVRWAQKRGARSVDGHEVLVRQGARSLELWTSLRAPVEAMREAVVQPAV